MSIPLTELAALEYDLDRELMGYDGPLTFERYRSGDDDGTVVLAVDKGWKLEETGSNTVRVLFTDREGARGSLFGVDKPSRFRAAGILYVISDNGIRQPKKEPRVWEVSGVEIRKARDV